MIWWGQGAGEIIGENGSHPSLTITNPPGGSAKAVWLYGNNAPYYFEFGPDQALQKSTDKKGVYHRRIIAKHPVTGDIFVLEIGEISVQTSKGDTIEINFDIIDDDQVKLSASFYANYLIPQVMDLPEDVEELMLNQTLYGRGIENISSSSKIKITYLLVDAQTTASLGSFYGGELTSEMADVNQTMLITNISNFAGQRVI